MKINFKERTPQLIAIIAVLVLILGIASIIIFNNKRQIKEMEQVHSIEKQDLEDEYEAISLQYEGFKFSVQNDSLLYKLENEQAKVLRLQEQLRLTKASDQSEIRRLKDELSTLRRVLRSYISQIDSLNRINEELRAENTQITKRYQDTRSTLNQVSQEREVLSEKVTLAAQLVATNISVRAINDRGRDQKRLSRSSQFEISFTISRNITASPGERTVFVRMMSPDGKVLTKSASNTFPYENGNIQYSIKRIVEYGGEEMQVKLFWDIEEFLMAGTYKTDIFADGNLIGSYIFSMEE